MWELFVGDTSSTNTTSSFAFRRGCLVPEAHVSVCRSGRPTAGYEDRAASSSQRSKRVNAARSWCVFRLPAANPVCARLRISASARELGVVFLGKVVGL